MRQKNTKKFTQAKRKLHKTQQKRNNLQNKSVQTLSGSQFSPLFSAQSAQFVLWKLVGK